jgi:galactokinase
VTPHPALEQLFETAVGRQAIALLYGGAPETLHAAQERYTRLADDFQSHFGENKVELFSTPGRVELGGNHSDHNQGKILAAGIHLDTIAAASVAPERRIIMYSSGYEHAFQVCLDELEPKESDRGTTTGLIRGIASRFQELGYAIGGFQASVASDVLPGSGLSSSASIEVLIGTVLNTLYNEGSIPPEVLASIGQYAENTYFGKPCGQMDQLTCAVGGIVAIDFADPGSPVVEKIEYVPDEDGLHFLVVHTGGSHADLTEEYAAIPREMKAVARHFGHDVCRDLDDRDFVFHLPELRAAVGDRAALRAFHFLSEQARVPRQVQALHEHDTDGFLKLVNASGNSSCRWLQNCFARGEVNEQGILVALALSEQFIGSAGRGACRVHGGGFAGTILTILPGETAGEYVRLMEHVFGAGCVTVLDLRSTGTIALSPQCFFHN